MPSPTRGLPESWLDLGLAVLLIAAGASWSVFYAASGAVLDLVMGLTCLGAALALARRRTARRERPRGLTPHRRGEGGQRDPAPVRMP